MFRCTEIVERFRGEGLRYCLKSEYLSPLSDQAIPQALTPEPPSQFENLHHILITVGYGNYHSHPELQYNKL